MHGPITGENYFGKTDIVEGYFSVSTFFFHVMFIPVIPLKTYLLVEDGNKREAAWQLPLNKRSVVLAYTRGMLWLALSVLVLLMIGHAAGPGTRPPQFFIALASPTGGIAVGCALVCVVIALLTTYLSKRLVRASYQRAMELAAIAQLDEYELLELAVHFGKLTHEQATAKRQELRRHKVGVERLGPG